MLCSISEVGKEERRFRYGVQSVPKCVWPVIKGTQTECNVTPGNIWRDPSASMSMPSAISSIKLYRSSSPSAVEADGTIQYALYPLTEIQKTFFPCLFFVLVS